MPLALQRSCRQHLTAAADQVCIHACSPWNEGGTRCKTASTPHTPVGVVHSYQVLTDDVELLKCVRVLWVSDVPDVLQVTDRVTSDQQSLLAYTESAAPRRPSRKGRCSVGLVVNAHAGTPPREERIKCRAARVLLLWPAECNAGLQVFAVRAQARSPQRLLVHLLVPAQTETGWRYRIAARELSQRS